MSSIYIDGKEIPITEKTDLEQIIAKLNCGWVSESDPDEDEEVYSRCYSATKGKGDQTQVFVVGFFFKSMYKDGTHDEAWISADVNGEFGVSSLDWPMFAGESPYFDTEGFTPLGKACFAKALQDIYVAPQHTCAILERNFAGVRFSKYLTARDRE